MKDNNLLFLKDSMLENINQFLSSNQWSIKDLSDAADIPYESVKKLVNGKVTNPSIFTLHKIATAMNCSIDYIVGRQETYGIHPSQLPKRAFNLLETIASLEMKLFAENQKYSTVQIPVLVPTNRIMDGAFYDSCTWENIAVPSNYTTAYDSLICGIKITNNQLEPAYFYNDILFLAQDKFPEKGDIGVFVLNNCIYIRKYNYGNGVTLESINGSAKPVVVRDISQLHFLGRIIGTLRR